MTKYVRYQSPLGPIYGVLEGDTIHQVHGNIFESYELTGKTEPLSAAKLLYPCEPANILAVGLNYRSHLGERKAPEQPELFLKPVSSLQNPEDPIITPPEAQNMHFEGELVAVMGANGQVFGVTCGNDVSEREWQRGANKDLQWWRAKGSNTFAPLGPVIVTGIDYSNLLLQTRVNGEVLQKQSTSDLLFDVPTIVERISKWVTLRPGDVVYTGTPGNTRKLNPGDVVEVEIEQIGVLRNPVV